MHSFIYFKCVHFITQNYKIEVRISQTCMHPEITWEFLNYVDACSKTKDSNLIVLGCGLGLWPQKLFK